MTYQGHSDVIFDLTWSPDGKLIVSASADGTAQVCGDQN
jgi:WD40 repeat protein